MRTAARVVGWICLALAVPLVVVGISTLPSGGLMFALPYVFLIPGALLGITGALLLWLGRDQRPGPPGPEPAGHGPEGGGDRR